MNFEKETRRGSKWRRSLMALAVLSAPVVSIAGFSGGASAAWDADDEVNLKQVCTADDPATTPANEYNVQIEIEIKSPNNGSGASQKWDIFVYQGSTVPLSPWQDGVTTDLNNGGGAETSRKWLYEVPDDLDGSYNVLVRKDDIPADAKLVTQLVSCSEPEGSFTAVGECVDGVPGISISVPDSKDGNGPKNVAVIDDNPEASSFADGTSFFVPLTAGATYKVQVKVGSTFLNYSDTDANFINVRVSAYGCDTPGTGVVSAVCSGDNSPGIRVNLVNEKPGEGPKYTLYINEVQQGAKFPDGHDQTYPTGTGTFDVLIEGADGEALFDQSVTVSCGGSNPNNPTFRFNLSLPKPLPKTGTDSNVLLVIAPVMVLLGAGLIMARRRLATV